MKKFEDLPPSEQWEVFGAVIAACIRCEPLLQRTPSAAAEAIGCTTTEFWRDALADAGLDDCHPWAGYPERSAILPELERIDLTDYGRRI